MDDIYQERILDHHEQPYHRGRSPRATHAHEDDNPLCGDFIHVDLAIDPQGKVEEAWFDGDGCCISQAAASILMEAIEGRNVEELKRFTPEQMLDLFGPKLTPTRQKCCLLAWRVVQSALYSPLTGRSNS
jgi:nitrogen fixation NifU-like protein